MDYPNGFELKCFEKYVNSCVENVFPKSPIDLFYPTLSYNRYTKDFVFSLKVTIGTFRIIVEYSNALPGVFEVSGENFHFWKYTWKGLDQSLKDLKIRIVTEMQESILGMEE